MHTVQMPCAAGAVKCSVTTEAQMQITDVQETLCQQADIWCSLFSTFTVSRPNLGGMLRPMFTLAAAAAFPPTLQIKKDPVPIMLSEPFRTGSCN